MQPSIVIRYLRNANHCTPKARAALSLRCKYSNHGANMKLLELFEARKNPEQNPKVSVNRQIYDALRTARGDTIAGIENLFVSFTAVDKLGINPQSEYKTPLGIYAYPARYVMKEAGSSRSMDASLPFAGEHPYANIFNAVGNIVNVATMSSGESVDYCRKVANLWAKVSGKDWKTSVDEVEDIISDASTHSKFAEYPGGRFWYVTRVAAKTLFGPKWGLTAPVAWNKIFRSIGIDGVVDYTDNGGHGIIHTSEPSQAVFFSIAAVGNVQRVDNKYSKAGMESRADYGAGKHTRVAQAAKEVAALDSKEAVNEYLINNGFHKLRFVKDKTIRQYIISRHPSSISYITRPTIDEQRAVLEQEIDYVRYINNADESLVLSMVNGGESEYTVAAIVQAFPKASERMQLYIASTAPSKAEAYISPDYIAPHAKIYPSVVTAAMAGYAKRGMRLPEWLTDAAARFNIPDTVRINHCKELISALQAERAKISKELADAEPTWVAEIEKLSKTNPESAKVLQQAFDGYVEQYKERVNAVETQLETAYKQLKLLTKR